MKNYIKEKIFAILFILFHFSSLSFGEIIFYEANSTTGNDKINLVSPIDGMTMSSFVASFKANSDLSGPFYLEISKDKYFNKGVKKIISNSVGKSTNNIYFLRDGIIELSEGKWYWHVASKLKNDWSITRSVIIDTSMTIKEPLREISSEKPFFLARFCSSICQNSDAEERIRKIIPDDLKDFFILDHSTTWPSFFKNYTAIEYYEKVNTLGYPFTMDLGNPDGSFRENQGGIAVTLGEAEYIFQHCQNCVGITSAELFYEYFQKNPLTRLFVDGAIDLAAKYGKLFLLADMNWKVNKWNMFSMINYNKFMERKLGRYFIPLYKTTDPWGALVCLSAIKGMGICNMVDNYGTWSDVRLWKKFGQPDNYNNGSYDEFPYIFNMKAFLLSISQGGTVTALEPTLAWDNKDSMPNENYYKYLIPFLRGVYQHHIMIHKDSIINATKVIAKLNFNPSKIMIDYVNDYYGNFFRSTYGLWDGGEDPSKEEIIPNTSRYSIIPFLPSDNAVIPKGKNVINIEDVQNEKSAENFIGKFYSKNTSQAYAIDLDNTIIILNNLENRDEREYYSLELGHKGVMRMFGQITLMSYIMGKRESKQYWFQMNGYTKGNHIGGLYDLQEYPSEVKFICSSRPSVKVEQPKSVIYQNWDENKKEFTLIVRHDKGAVNFSISVP